MQAIRYTWLGMAVFGRGIALTGCSKTSQPDVKPTAVIETRQAALLTNPSGQPYSVRQQAWLNFVEKVRSGAQADPAGQYIADGTIMPANARATRPKLDAATDTYPFLLLPDGTVVMRPASELKAMQAHRPLPPGPDCDVETECPQGPVVTSTFVSSVGMGGSGDIVDVKIYYDGAYPAIYTLLNANLNKGAGGSVIYYYFTRNPYEVQKGVEYNDSFHFPNLSVFDPVVAYDVKEKHYYFSALPAQSPGFAYMWHPNDPDNSFWDVIDLNRGAGGEYVYSYQSKQGGVTPDATPFHEIGIISGNSASIQPPAGWIKRPQDLNDAAGGDYIYFCYKP